MWEWSQKRWATHVAVTKGMAQRKRQNKGMKEEREEKRRQKKRKRKGWEEGVREREGKKMRKERGDDETKKRTRNRRGRKRKRLTRQVHWLLDSMGLPSLFHYWNFLNSCLESLYISKSFLNLRILLFSWTSMNIKEVGIPRILKVTFDFSGGYNSKFQ